MIAESYLIEVERLPIDVRALLISIHPLPNDVNLIQNKIEAFARAQKPQINIILYYPKRLQCTWRRVHGHKVHSLDGLPHRKSFGHDQA